MIYNITISKQNNVDVSDNTCLTVWLFRTSSFKLSVRALVMLKGLLEYAMQMKN